METKLQLSDEMLSTIEKNLESIKKELQNHQFTRDSLPEVLMLENVILTMFWYRDAGKIFSTIEQKLREYKQEKGK